MDTNNLEVKWLEDKHVKQEETGRGTPREEGPW